MRSQFGFLVAQWIGAPEGFHLLSGEYPAEQSRFGDLAFEDPRILRSDLTEGELGGIRLIFEELVTIASGSDS